MRWWLYSICIIALILLALFFAAFLGEYLDVVRHCESDVEKARSYIDMYCQNKTLVDALKANEYCDAAAHKLHWNYRAWASTRAMKRIVQYFVPDSKSCNNIFHRIFIPVEHVLITVLALSLFFSLGLVRCIRSDMLNNMIRQYTPHSKKED